MRAYEFIDEVIDIEDKFINLDSLMNTGDRHFNDVSDNIINLEKMISQQSNEYTILASKIWTRQEIYDAIRALNGYLKYLHDYDPRLKVLPHYCKEMRRYMMGETIK